KRRGPTGTAARSPRKAQRPAAGRTSCGSPGRPNSMGFATTDSLGIEPDIAKAKSNPGLARALELIRLGIRREGVREWLYSIRYFDDAQLIAAAELARRAEVYDRAIHTADRTQRSHNFVLRYPVLFHDVFRDYAKTHGLDEAWVLGLVRQESRFIADARS